MKQQIVELIKSERKLSKEVRLKYFSDKSVKEIRDWFEENGLDRHLPIELNSTEIVVQVPGVGILMQIRAADKNQLGLWGGAIENGETPIDGAIRELYEETGLVVKAEDLAFIELNTHKHQYANGDIALFKSYRFALSLPHMETLKLDDESNGWKVISTLEDLKSVLEHQQDFLKKFILGSNYQGD